MSRVGSRVALGVACTLALAGCGSLGESASSLGNTIVMGGPPPPPAAAATQDVFCPEVQVIDGGAALQAYSGGRVGEASALRSQITLGQIARECNGQADGSTLVKIGVEGRALVGVSGSAGRFDVPLRFVVKSGSTVFADHSRRTSVSIPAG